MISIRDDIQSCQKCPLYHNMSVSPIATEIFGPNPLVLFLCTSDPKEKNDLSQQVLSEANRAILKNVCAVVGVDYATTFLVKCIRGGNAKGYTKNQIKDCSAHIFNECKLLGVKSLVIMGTNNLKHFDPAGVNVPNQYTTSAPNILFNNKQELNKLTSYLRGIKDDYT